MKLGCCYYPEHWPEELWESDAERMSALGLSYVRISEFAWSRIEPKPGLYDWEWLDRAVDVLANAGLKIIMGTPTATPPKWLIDKYPDILSCDAYGRPRNFGSRRHYSFSSKTYLRESARIVEAMARRYGAHPSIVMWQTDNEYGCHDTVESNDLDARAAFRQWLQSKYETVSDLNAAWGCVFWSQEYRDFEEVDPPLATVTEANPSHVLDWRRFSSDQVAAYNQMQIDIIREHAHDRDITHNFMGHFTEFDHYPVGEQIDISTWDSYPLGFLEQAWWEPETKVFYARTGHPDFAAFHHDLYRGMSNGRWGVMEQQPGPVNWARYNPAPLDGMVSLWTLEAAAHGAELVSYFRWRQAPFAQEQMHAGLNRPDNSPDIASIEAKNVLQVLSAVGEINEHPKADVALIFDYEAQWIFEIQPQGRSFNYARLAFQFYTSLRQKGLNVDIIGPNASIDGYKLVVIPSLPIVSDELAKQLETSDAEILIGPRTGSKTETLQIPEKLAPGKLADLLKTKVWRVESLRDGLTQTGSIEGSEFSTEIWKESVESAAEIMAQHTDGSPAMLRAENAVYLPVWPHSELLSAALESAIRKLGWQSLEMPDGLRIRRCGELTFAFNYGETVNLTAHEIMPENAKLLYGTVDLPRAGVGIWKE